MIRKFTNHTLHLEKETLITKSNEMIAKGHYNHATSNLAINSHETHQDKLSEA